MTQSVNEGMGGWTASVAQTQERYHPSHASGYESMTRNQRERVAALETDVKELRRELEQVRALTATRPPALLRHGKRVWRAVRRRRFDFTPKVLADVVEVLPRTFKCQGLDPSLQMFPTCQQYPYGWLRFHVNVETEPGSELSIRIYFDCGGGFHEHLAFSRSLKSSARGYLSFVQYLPPGVVRLRLDPNVTGDGTFLLREFVAQEITKQEAFASAGWAFVRNGVAEPMRLAQSGLRLARICRHNGFGGVLNDLVGRTDGSALNYENWVALYDTIDANDRAAICERIAALPHKPRISILMPVYNTPEKLLKRVIKSVTSQMYPYWELCIANDCSTQPHVAAVLRKAAASDKRIKIIERKTNGHISAASNSALEIATGDFVALLDHDDELAAHALYMVAEELNAHPQARIIYSDEDKIDESGRRSAPYFKPDWNPDLLLSQNYVSHLGVYERRLIKEIGGFRTGYEGAQDYDLLLRAVEQVSENAIRHIPHVLYHWRTVEGSTARGGSEKPYAYIAAERAIQDHLDRRNVKAQVSSAFAPGHYRVRYALPARLQQVTLIIPTRDRLDLLEQCIESIKNRTRYESYDIIIVDNQSQEERTRAYFKTIEREHSNIRVIPYDAPFDYAALTNMAVRQAKGTVIGLLNNDLEVLNEEWLEEMLSHALRPEVGAVGAKLYYPDLTLQHGGVIFGIAGLAGHAHKYLPPSTPGSFGRMRLIQSFSAVTAACLLVRRDLFLKVGGLNARFPVAFNDLDFCLRLRQQGFRNVWTPYAELIHHESASRGPDTQGKKLQRLLGEMEQMREIWGELIDNDPGYNPNLTLDVENFTPAFPPRARKPWKHPLQDPINLKGV